MSGFYWHNCFVSAGIALGSLPQGLQLPPKGPGRFQVFQWRLETRVTVSDHVATNQKVLCHVQRLIMNWSRVPVPLYHVLRLLCSQTNSSNKFLRITVQFSIWQEGLLWSIIFFEVRCSAVGCFLVSEITRRFFLMNSGDCIICSSLSKASALPPKILWTRHEKCSECKYHQGNLKQISSKNNKHSAHV